jgi:putative heme iron utilization protein
MDEPTARLLRRVIHEPRLAALGTLREGAPFVSLVAILPEPDASAFLLHASLLAYHTQDFLADPRASLLLSEPDDGRDDPQTLARLSIRGTVERLDPDQPRYPAARARYLARFPASAVTFQLGDFALYAVRPAGARFVAGLGRTFNLSAPELARLGARPDAP